MSTPTLTVKRTIQAPRERVYEAWTQADLLSRWFHLAPEWTSDFQGEPAVGGAYTLKMHTPEGETHDMRGEFVELVPVERIVFSWTSGKVENSRVTVELTEADGATEVTLTHEFLPDKESREAHGQGWNGCLASLASVLEQ